MNGKLQYLLVVAKSARMLAQGARKAGFRTLAIDLWGDQDTSRLVEELQPIPSLSKDCLSPAIESLINRYPVTGVVYGSGFEQHPESLGSLGDCLTVLGNPPDVFTKLQDKPAFFDLLKKLQIPYPEVSFHLPGQDAGWLVKPVQGQGGVGITRYRLGETAEPSVYWQKYQEGVPHSVLFLADGKQSQAIGFNRQWTVPLNSRDEFIFSGIINDSELPLGQKTRICDWLDRLVPELSLKGLNSLDFIQFGQASYVLEINPRPPASMQLYDADLLVRHIQACQGRLLDDQPEQTGFTAYQIVYAQQDMQIPSGFEWPDGSLDLPIAGAIISTGQPICSIITHAKDSQDALGLLQNKQDYITRQLERFQIHGIQRQY